MAQREYLTSSIRNSTCLDPFKRIYEHNNLKERGISFIDFLVRVNPTHLKEFLTELLPNSRDF